MLPLHTYKTKTTNKKTHTQTTHCESSGHRIDTMATVHIPVIPQCLAPVLQTAFCVRLDIRLSVVVFFATLKNIYCFFFSLVMKCQIVEDDRVSPDVTVKRVFSHVNLLWSCFFATGLCNVPKTLYSDLLISR